MKEKIAGIDLGYNAVKAYSEDGFVTFKSVVGSPDKSEFQILGKGDDPIVVNGVPFRYGESAIKHSATPYRHEDRNWIRSEQYSQLFAAALNELFRKSAEVKVVTGLPINFMSDADELKEIICKEFVVEDGNKEKTFVVSKESRVIPQPFGTVFQQGLNDNGEIVDIDLLKSKLGIIDIGGKTTNFLYIEGTSEIGYQSHSISAGGWDIVRAVSNFITDEFPELELRDHEISDAISNGYVKIFGDEKSIYHIIEPIASRMVSRIVGKATELWNAGGRIDRILITGGGSLLLGQMVIDKYKHGKMEIIENPVSANAKGYYKFAKKIFE